MALGDSTLQINFGPLQSTTKMKGIDEKRKKQKRKKLPRFPYVPSVTTKALQGG